MITVIVNPTASGGRVRNDWPQIEGILREQGLAFSAQLTTHRGHATELARAALDLGHRQFISVGGDGTFNEVLNGLVVNGRPHPDATLCVVPGGTGSDFVRALGTPKDPFVAARSAFRGPTRLLDVGEIRCQRDGRDETRYFANVAGLGFDGEVCVNVNRSSKRVGGTTPYVLNLVLTLFTYHNKDAELEMDGKRISGRFNTIALCNGQYYGGGMQIGPHAEMDDGLFDVVTLGNLSRLEVLANLPRIYRGTHLSHPKVKWSRASSVSVRSTQRMFIQAEGELVGETPAEFHLIHQALRLST